MAENRPQMQHILLHLDTSVTKTRNRIHGSFQPKTDNMLYLCFFLTQGVSIKDGGGTPCTPDPVCPGCDEKNKMPEQGSGTGTAYVHPRSHRVHVRPGVGNCLFQVMPLSGPDNMHLGASQGGRAGGRGVKLRKTSRKPGILYLLVGTPKFIARSPRRISA